MQAPTHNIALYGGTFDPVHLGHLKVARAAASRFNLERVYFVPADVQPLKANQQVTAFYHRFAMLALALAGEEKFVPSLLEAPEIVRASGRPASYTIDTVARMRGRLPQNTRLFFIIGMDAFQQIAKWRSPIKLLRSAEFIVASRPGFPVSEILQALPSELRPAATIPHAAGEQTTCESESLSSNGAIIHLLPELHEEASATGIREAVRNGGDLESLVPPPVAEYIRKLGLYSGSADPGSPELPRP